MVADRGRRADRAVPVSRSHLPRGEPAEGVRGRLGAAGARRGRDAADVHLAARQPAAVREIAQAGVSAGRSGGDAGEAAAAAGARHRRVPDQRSRQRADRADAQPEALQGAAREERHSHHRDRADAADRSVRTGAAGGDQRDLLQGDAAVRLHGIAQRAENAGDRAQARLAVRHHVDVVLPVAARAEAGRAFRHAALAGSSVHRAQPHGQRRHRLFPDSDRPGGRGGNAGHHLDACQAFSQCVLALDFRPRQRRRWRAESGESASCRFAERVPRIVRRISVADQIRFTI